MMDYIIILADWYLIGCIFYWPALHIFQPKANQFNIKLLILGMLFWPVWIVYFNLKKPEK